MDILRPSLDQQVSPAPWLVARSKVDLPKLIRQALTKQPDANAEAIVRQLADWHVQANWIVVSMQLSKLRALDASARFAEPSQLMGQTIPAINSYSHSFKSQSQSGSKSNKIRMPAG